MIVFERQEVTEGWRKMHNEELHNIHCSPNIRVDEIGGTFITDGT